jgi:potassium-transporting ATPase potassium-binding subunit
VLERTPERRFSGFFILNDRFKEIFCMLTGILQIILLLSILTVGAVLLGRYMAKVFGDAAPFPATGFLEKGLYRLFGADEKEDMGWRTYAANLVIFNLICMVALFVLQELQHFLPLNPQKFGPVRWDTALNTAVSFATNTNWQAYGGESTMSYLTQMLGLAVQNFLSAAIGIAACIAFIRAFVRHSVSKIGNFWVDLTRTVLYILLPLSIILSLILVSQGVIQNLNPYVKAKTLQGQEQVIAQGPAASQIAIKHIGTNGGGFFNANSAHPYENPTPLTDYLEILALLMISAALPFTFGRMYGSNKQGWVIFLAMLLLYVGGLSVALLSELHGNPLLAKLGIAHGINMEGKEVRFGELASVVFAHSTTVTSCGAVNCMHDSLMPVTGMILIFNIAIGEVIFGGVGTGLISMIIYAIITMFLAGLMIGRTPEIFGKKLEPFEMVMAVIVLLSSSITQLALGAVSVSSGIGLSSLNNAGPHGMSEIIYAFVSAAGNNGSAFAGLNANTPFYNLATASAMLIGRFTVIIPSLAIAGALARKKMVPKSVKFPTEGPLFVAMLISVVIIVGALTFFPVLVLGPYLEHLMILAGKMF